MKLDPLDPELMLDIPAELERLRKKLDVTGDLTADEHDRFVRLAGKLRAIVGGRRG